MVNSNLMVKFLKFKPNGKFKGKGPNGKFKPKGHIFLTLNPMVNSNLKVKILKFKLKSHSCSINMTIFFLISINFYKILSSIRFLFSLNGFPLWHWFYFSKWWASIWLILWWWWFGTYSSYCHRRIKQGASTSRRCSVQPCRFI